jgi:group II intron reverse transcriptase/maturase
MEMDIIDNIVIEIKSGKFRFSPVRRVYIPKPGSERKRPLGIPTLKDRIVQEAIRLILESIYEPIFEKHYFSNYGFRPNKSCHDALKFLRRNGTACNYAIEGDIKGAFDNVQPKVLINILRKRIEDNFFLDLINQGFYCGLFEFEKYSETELGVPQGGIASPLLFNIYMNEFDDYINNKLQSTIARYNKIQNRSIEAMINPAYKKINVYYYNSMLKRVAIKKLKDMKPWEKNTFFKYLVKKRELERLRIKIPAILKEKRPIKIVYTRYADDWIILTNANLRFATLLKDHIGKWLNIHLKLTLSKEKTLITNIRTDYAHFLGFVIYAYDSAKISRSKKTNSLIRSAEYSIKIGINMEKVLNRMFIKGFCDKKHKPISKRPYSVLSLKEILDKYNAIIRGMANYYIPIIDRFRPFTQVHYILYYSCLGTIAQKYKTSTFKLMKKFGKPPIFKIETTIKNKQTNKIEKKQKEMQIISYLDSKELASKSNDPGTGNFFVPMKKVNWRTYKNLSAYCCICGTRENIEWHHTRSIKKGKVYGFAQVKKQLNRLQIPICKQHHKEITAGKYDGIKLSELMEIDYWLI